MKTVLSFKGEEAAYSDIPAGDAENTQLAILLDAGEVGTMLAFTDRMQKAPSLDIATHTAARHLSEQLRTSPKGASFTLSVDGLALESFRKMVASTKSEPITDTSEQALLDEFLDLLDEAPASAAPQESTDAGGSETGVGDNKLS